ncbi:MAG TPA: helix-hairpin-helix domain-containing protein [Gemmataceae bacterium]|nr:helix-hairpin-helix domain-containing protein [Gemmataceae bacterium]
MTNGQVADRLEEVARLLELQNANPFRVRAYRTAAELVRTQTKPVHAVLKTEGLEGLTRLPGIGLSLARTIERLAFTDRLGLLDRLRGQDEPVRLLTTVAGIGPKMAHRIHEQLGIETLEEMEVAAYDGRLRQVAGIGRKRLAAIRDSLAGRFRRRPRVPESLPTFPQDQPPVAELLDVDEEYRAKASKRQLPLIAPRRFNPTGEAWLPVLHTERDSRHYTALFSNTARAHELGTTRDWVVIYRDDHGGASQWTAVTARWGPCATDASFAGESKSARSSTRGDLKT